MSPLLTMKLSPDESIDVQVASGGRLVTVRLTARRDDRGTVSIDLGGVDCDLEGDAPGSYYLLPHDAGDAEEDPLAVNTCPGCGAGDCTPDTCPATSEATP